MYIKELGYYLIRWLRNSYGILQGFVSNNLDYYRLLQIMYDLIIFYKIFLEFWSEFWRFIFNFTNLGIRKLDDRRILEITKIIEYDRILFVFKELVPNGEFCKDFVPNQEKGRRKV